MPKITKRRLILGITGGIATGKSTVMRILKQSRIPTISADDLAHTCIRKGHPAYRSIVRYFGKSILASNGEIDRRRLGQIVFSDASKRRKLEKMVHPCVARGLMHFIATHRGVIALDIPLLFEAKYEKWVDKIIVVYSTPSQQLKRFMSRTGLSRAEAQRRIASQLPLTVKCRRADIILKNTRNTLYLKRQVNALLGLTLRALAT